MTAFNPDVALGTKTTSSGRAPTKSASLPRASASRPGRSSPPQNQRAAFRVKKSVGPVSSSRWIAWYSSNTGTGHAPKLPWFRCTTSGSKRNPSRIYGALQRGGNSGTGQEGSGLQSSQPVGKGHSASTRSPSPRIAATSSCVNRPWHTYPLHLLFILPAPRPVRLDHEIELVIVGVEFTTLSDERRLQIDVPAGESPLRPFPEVPDRVRLAGAMVDEDALAGPLTATLPRMLSLERPTIGREPEARARSDVDRRLRAIVSDDANREGRVRAPAPRLTPHDLVARLPGHRRTLPGVA